MNKLTSWKRIGSLLLTLAMVFTMSVTALPVYAAGTGTISVKYNPDVANLESTDFVLYKAGKYGRTDDGKKSIIVLEDQFKDSGVVFPNGVEPDDANWQSAWLGAANDLGSWAKNHEKDLESAWKGTLSKSDAFQDLGEFANGVYLLVGKEKLVDEAFWTPVPVLIQVLNGESKFVLEDVELKMTSRPLVHKHTVNKFWQDEDVEGRPQTVKVAIFYGDTKIDTVEFSKEKGYVYTWYSYLDKSGKWIYTSKDPENDKAKGVATEKLNDGNKFQINYDGEKEVTWGAEELPHGNYAAGENMYVANVPTGKPITDDSEIFDITNTVVTPVDHDPPVKKVIVGDKPKKSEDFVFSLTAISKPDNVDEFPMPEGSDGNVKTMTCPGGEEREFGDIVFRVPGEYRYEIKEVNTGKKGYKYDPTVYTLVYNMTVEESEPGVYNLHMDRTLLKDGVDMGDVATYEFVNTYKAPPGPGPGPGPLTGDNAKIMIPVAIFAAALIAFIVMFIKRRKNGKDNN